MIEAIEATFIQLISGIAWGQWLAAGFLLVLGIFLGTMLARSVGRLVESRTSRHHQVLIRRLVFYVIFVLFAIAALREAGFSLEVVLGAAGILTVAIGFASQTSASNIISGLFLVMERPFEIGDVIEADATIGEVVA
ncbi:MAG TPA: mechanosensitive ion channel protein, partial [Marinobacter hydrocarbonoclasticus]|nr:mechanosensitive ion channel protein [Marinobacter nauticus]